MDERSVPNTAAGGSAHRAVMIPGADDGRVQTFIDEGGATKAHVKDLDANAALAAIEILLKGGLVKRETDLDDPDFIYKGWAPRGTTKSASAWTIERIQMVNGNPTETVVAGPNAVWDNRSTETYT